MLHLALALLLSQAQPVKIVNPTNQSKAATTTTVGPKEALDVNCISGCSGGSGGGGAITLGAVAQDVSRDGGVDWPVEAKITKSVQLAIGFDGGLVTAIQGPGFDGGPSWDVSGSIVSVGNFPGTQTVTGTLACTGPLTDAQMRATPVPVSGSLSCSVASTTVTNTVAVSGPVTDTQLRASPVPVSGSLTCSVGTVPVTQSFGIDGGRAWDVSGSIVSVSNFPASQAVTNSSLANLDVALSTRTKPADQQHTIVDSSATIAVTGPLTDAQLRASAVPVSGSLTCTVANTIAAQGVGIDGGRAWDVSGSHVIVDSAPVTHAIIDSSASLTCTVASTTITGSVAVTGPLTDAALRASAVPVSLASTTITGTATVAGTVTANQGTGPDGGRTYDVSGSHVVVDSAPVTHAIIDSSASIAVTLASAPTTAVTNAGLSNLDVLLSTRTKPADQQHTIIDSSATLTCTVASTTITGSVAVTGPLTDAALRASAVPVSLATAPTTPVTGTFWQASQPVSQNTSRDGGTDWAVEAKVTSMPVTHAIIDSSAAIAVTGPATDAQMRASPIPVNGTVTATVTGATLGAGSAVIGHVILDASSAVIGHVIVDTAPTTAVTLATAPALVASSAIIGNVRIDQTTPGTTNAVQANAGTNLNTSALALDATLTGRTTKVQITDGTRDGTVKAASTLPVASDTATVVTVRDAIALAASSAVIGHVINDASSAVIGHVIADTGSTTACTQATGTNLHAVLDATSTTAVTQATGTNLHAVIDTGSTTACTQATGTNLHTVVDSITAGTVTCNAGTNLNTSTLALDATLTGGTAKAKLVDTGGSTAATVKAASTASAAADTALVVVQSPNGGNPCQNPSATIVGLSGATSGTASVQLVAISGSTKIYVCSLNVTGVSGTTPTFKLQYGTGSVCGTGTVGIIGPFTSTANTVFSFMGTAGVAVTPAGQALCYIQTGTTPISNYNLTYVQQ